MDLAKIRNKSLQSQAAAVQNPEQVHDAPCRVVLPVVEPCLESRTPELVVTPDTQNAQRGGIVERTPLDIILEGRVAAGCDLELVTTSDEDESAARVVDYLEFLSFRVSGEIYGINILDIKEIIKPRTVTEVPRAPVFLSGIISLRGTIIPIIDMRTRLGLPRVDTTGKERIIVIRSQDTFSGLLVDEILQVMRVQRQSVEPAPAVLDGIDREFVNGIGRSDGRLIIILNLATVTNCDVC